MQAQDVRLADVQKLGDRLVGQLDELREAAPVFWSPTQYAWIITGHRQTNDAFLRANIFSSGSRAQRVQSFLKPEERGTRANYLIDTLNRMLFSLDAPEHPRIRRLMMGAFGRNVIEPYRADVRRIVSEALDRAERAGTCEYVDTVAHFIPSNVILKLLGLPETFLPSMRSWSNRVTAGVGGGGATPELIDGADRAMQEMRDAFMPEINSRRANPTGDFISTLITAEDNGERLSDEEILANCYLVLTAGHDTTSNTIALSTVLLARDADLWSFFKQEHNQEELLAAVLELGRVIGMSFASARVVAQDVEWEGCQLKKGQLVYLMQGIANRDPQSFANPDRADVARQQNGNLAFGMGAHMCIGHLVAKMQLTEFFPQLARRFSRIEVLDNQLHWGTSVGFRGLQALNVRVHS